MLVGLDLRLASPRLRRWVTVEAARRCRQARPLHRIALHLRRGPAGARVLAALGPATIDVWAIKVERVEDALTHFPAEGVAPAQATLIREVPEEDMLRAATGIVAWLRFEGDVLVSSTGPTAPGGGTPGAQRGSAATINTKAFLRV